MPENKKMYLGDGSDNFGQAAGQAAKAAKNIGKQAAGAAAVKGAEATATAAAATVKAGVEGGKAVAQVAAGTAVGGPVGAAVSIAWSMRHTLFKVLITICLCLLFLVVLLASLPSIISTYLFGSDTAPPTVGATIQSVYSTLEAEVSSAVQGGYDIALAKVEDIIRSGDYDYDISMDAVINHAQSSAGYDTCYILAAYSASMGQEGTSAADMIVKLTQLQDMMFPVTYEVKTKTVTVTSGDTSTTRTVTYVECTIHPFDTGIVHAAFHIAPDASYMGFGITYGEVISNMADSLKRMLYGSAAGGESVPLTDAELIAYVNQQGTEGARKALLEAGLSLVGKVPYFWGGKSGPGWNTEWNTPKLVTSAGSVSTGTIRPYGLDCSGFTSWVYSTALGVDIGAGTGGQFPNTVSVTARELQIGDLGFLAGTGGYSHVLMFAGYGEGGERKWVHSSSSSGVVLNTPSYDAQLVLRRPRNVSYESH